MPRSRGASNHPSGTAPTTAHQEVNKVKTDGITMREDQAPPSPFQPGYGRRPAVYGGHEQEIAELTEVFRTLDFGENHSVLVSGLRGAGKTALL